MSTADLRTLARLHGVVLSYNDLHGELHRATPESLLAVLAALGVDIGAPEHAGEALAARRAELAERLLPPCLVSWDAEPIAVPVALAADTDRIELDVVTEDGERIRESLDPDSLEPAPVKVGGLSVRRVLVPLPSLPMGYHRVAVVAGRRRARATLISASRRLPQPRGRTWGIFAPLYALRSKRRPSGGATLTELGELGSWVAAMGGGLVATLPLLAGFIDERTETSPYRPISRRLFNELYLDPARIAGFADCRAARELWEAKDYRLSSRELAGARDVDVRSLMGHRRRVLARLASYAWETPALRAELDAFVDSRPEVLAYSQFRANTTAREAPWSAWPAAERDGDLSGAELSRELVGYHQYVQWQLHQQLGVAADRARRQGPGLYLDLPVGVHPDGFDTWHDRQQFCMDVEVGAPPDDLNAGGQNWALPAIHPERSRAAGHHHIRDCIRAHLRYAGVLRIDHVMGLRRLFWIPRGGSATDGVYVRYPDRELFATLSVEAHRARAVIVGEDLGTVPDSVRAALGEHGARGMFVGMFSFGGQVGSTMYPPPAGTVASFGTHDTATFAGFATGADIEVQRELDLVDDEQRAELQRGRDSLMTHLRTTFGAEDSEDGLRAIHDGLLDEMSTSDAWAVLVTLEDLWLERDPQNVPGTGAERRNWTRKLARTVDEVVADDDLRDRLVQLFGNRSGG